MSTQINITVGSSGLTDKAKQQQLAARQAQLERERQQRIEAQGTEQRNAKLAAEGKAPDGSPLYGPGFNQPEIERRPAANRTGYGALLTGPFTYSTYGGSNSGLTVRCRGNRNVIASRFSYEEDKVYPEGVSVAGPSTSSYALEPAPVPGQPEPVFYYGQRQDTGDFLGWLNYSEASTNLPEFNCIYAVQNQAYDTVLDWQSAGSTITAPPYNVVNLNGNLQIVGGFKPLRTSSTFTHEFIMRMPLDKFDDDPSTAYVTSPNAPSRLARILVTFGGINIVIFAQPEWQYGTDVFRIQLTQPTTASLFVYESQRLNDFKCQCNVFAPTFKTTGGLSIEGDVGQFPLTDILPGSFLHCALTRYIENNVARWAIYLNGAPLITGIQEPANWTTTYGTQPPSTLIRVSSSRNAYASNVLPVMALHAARFTPKVLYTGSFTPPSSITGFA